MTRQFCDLENKTVLITGAANGIGEACAHELNRAGANLILSDIDLDKCLKLADNLKQVGTEVKAVYLDVAEPDNWDNVVAYSVEQFGQIDVLVNNAGIYHGGLIEQSSDQEFSQMSAINIDSIFYGTRCMSEVMKTNGGSIINMSSIAGLFGIPGHFMYGISKGAVRSATKHAAIEFAQLGYNIRVNSIHPGLIATEMSDQALQDLIDIGIATNIQEAQSAALKIIPMTRLGLPEEVANLVRFLASDEAAYCTGAEFSIDGGIAAG